MNPSDEPSWGTLLSRPYLPTVAILAMAVWLHAANSNLTAATMPSAIVELGGLAFLSWAFALYLTGSIIAAASVSLAVARLGLRRTMLAATLIYFLGTVICATAPNFAVLLGARVIQGLGGGALVALVFVSQDRFFPNAFVPRVVACISVVWTTAACIGPLIGGAFATWSSWRLAFWAFAVQALLLLPAIAYLLREDRPVTRTPTRRLPLVRLTLLAGAILFTSAAGVGTTLMGSALWLACGLAALAAFVITDSRVDSGNMLPKAAFQRGHRVGSGLLMTLLLSLTLMTFSTYGPVILINLHGLTPISAGMLVMLEAIGWGSAAIAFSATPKTREHLLIRAGSIAVGISLLCLALALARGPVWLIGLVVLVAKAAFGMMWGFIIKRVIGAAPEDEKDCTSSMLPTTQQTGFAIGAALCGLIANGLGLNTVMEPEVLRNIAFWLYAAFAPVAAIGAAVAWRFTAPPRRSGSRSG